MPPSIELIVAASENGVIGHEGNLPWRLSADLRRFKSLTMGHTLVMGRKTYESIGRPLPGRMTVVLTRSGNWQPNADSVPADLSSVQVAHTLDEAIQLAAAAEGMNQEKLFVAGGGEIYRLALPRATRIHRTRVHTTTDGDAYFPALDLSEWERIEATDHSADEKNEHPFTFELFERRSAAADPS